MLFSWTDAVWTARAVSGVSRKAEEKGKNEENILTGGNTTGACARSSSNRASKTRQSDYATSFGVSAEGSAAADGELLKAT